MSADSSSSPAGASLLISNQLPITHQAIPMMGTTSFSMSSGGLVTGLEWTFQDDYVRVWYGSAPALEVPDAEAGPIVKRLQEEPKTAHPVFNVRR